MKLYNTLARKIEDFKPINPPNVGIYICGPTVYDYSHLGHSRTYVNSDVLVRTLRWLGFEVKSVMNITDVGHLTSQADTGEDKMEKKARQENKNIMEIAKFYTEDFWQMGESLNIIKPDIVTPASEYITEMIELVKRLEQKGFTYKTSDGIYFDTSKFPDYGRLARIDIKGLKEGWRVEKNPEKKNPTDFALWKLSPPAGGEKRQMEWSSPWGVGFPGWHIECSAMSMKHLGESFDSFGKLRVNGEQGRTIDIHTGGFDHIPIHHPNEIAQSEAATGKTFVKYWFHSNFLEIDGEKMSKSLGNFIRLADLIKKGYRPLSLRYLFLTSHYRTKMNFTFKALEAAQEAYNRLKSITANWQSKKSRISLSEEKLKKIQDFSARFKEAVENDLNTPQAIAIMWEMVKSSIPDRDKWELITDWDRVLGLSLMQVSNNQLPIPNEIGKLVKKREELRKQKQWREADEIRKKIEALGFKVEDQGKESILKPKGS